jgi:hypothetical protein
VGVRITTGLRLPCPLSWTSSSQCAWLASIRMSYPSPLAPHWVAGWIDHAESCDSHLCLFSSHYSKDKILHLDAWILTLLKLSALSLPFPLSGFSSHSLSHNERILTFRVLPASPQPVALSSPVECKIKYGVILISFWSDKWYYCWPWCHKQISLCESSSKNMCVKNKMK